MQKQMLMWPKVLFVALGIMLGGTALRVRAEPNAQEATHQARTSANADITKVVPEQVHELKLKSVVLAADDMDRRSQPNRRLRATSAGLFATGYVPAAVTAMANSKGTSGWLAVPVVGPWVEWGPNTSAGNKALLFGSGLLQAAGVTGFVASYFMPERKVRKVPTMSMGKHKVNLSPIAGRDNTYLMSATGVF